MLHPRHPNRRPRGAGDRHACVSALCLGTASCHPPFPLSPEAKPTAPDSVLGWLAVYGERIRYELRALPLSGAPAAFLPVFLGRWKPSHQHDVASVPRWARSSGSGNCSQDYGGQACMHARRMHPHPVPSRTRPKGLRMYILHVGRTDTSRCGRQGARRPEEETPHTYLFHWPTGPVTLGPRCLPERERRIVSCRTPPHNSSRRCVTPWKSAPPLLCRFAMVVGGFLVSGVVLGFGPVSWA